MQRAAEEGERVGTRESDNEGCDILHNMQAVTMTLTECKMYFA